MQKKIKNVNHYYLRYEENKELRKIETYIKNGVSEYTLSLKNKVSILKLHELFDGYHERKIGLEEFLGISSGNFEDYFDKAIKLFENYFIARNQKESLDEAIKKIRKLKNREGYNFLEALRRDKLEKQLNKILWYVIPRKKDIRYIFMKVKKSSESIYYFTHIDYFKHLYEFLNLEMPKEEVMHNDLINIEFVRLKKVLKDKRVKIETLDSEHEKLQKNLAEYYSIAEFYYYA